MRRGEVWWADFNEQRAVVLLSGEEASGFLAMQVVAPAGTDLSGVAVEVAVGAPEGLPLEGVLRVALPRPDLIPCTWLVTLAREDLTEQAGVLPSAKLSEIEDALRLGGLK
ncbi:type II toxin-antitoxin system PemK/MazF family toxin [Streptomyces phaeochromogenes]